MPFLAFSARFHIYVDKHIISTNINRNKGEKNEEIKQV